MPTTENNEQLLCLLAATDDGQKRPRKKTWNRREKKIEFKSQCVWIIILN